MDGAESDGPLILVVGQRRTGKTSLVRTVLAESGLPNVWLDAHAFAELPTLKKGSLLVILERELNNVVRREKKWRKKLFEALTGVRWLRINSKPPWIHFEWERTDRDFDVLDLIHSFNTLARENGTRFVLVFDEAQEFRKMKGYSLQALMSYIYDNLDSVQMIVTGSQFGFLYSFLGIGNPESSLYGRGAIEIKAPRVSRELAKGFLEEGFRQAGITPVPAIIDSAIEKLDGVMGWLTLFGSRSVELGSCSEEALSETIEKGSKLTLQEFYHFLRLRKGAERRYVQ
ncbi:MAG: ATP-binding protein [Candidatus Hadarchaeales archaeon]